MASADRSETDVLVRAAWHYYVDEMTQDEIAKVFGISRASAGRLLDRARREGIVTFTINSPYLPAFHVGRELVDLYDLKDVVVVPDLPEVVETQAASNTRIAQAAAQYLANRLQPGTVLGMGWGETVHLTCEFLPSEPLKDVQTVTLTGGVDAYVATLRNVKNTNGSKITNFVIPTPLLTSSPAVAEALRHEPGVGDVLGKARNADIALVGIGAVVGTPTLTQFGYADEVQLREYADLGIVGDILSIFYDADGTTVPLEAYESRIGIDLEDLRSIDMVIGAAGGKDKLQAIRGALAGGYLDVLITTESVAFALVEERQGELDPGALASSKRIANGSSPPERE
ncbi:sugar-binding transcriptional regulator [Ruania rhizosphaerae]|uniref:sugar-binding transcriptional regulator n=1 Tax=Ruania rhizosphaerae TaxID=1840413 RepID=UPI00135CED53|nr:sugar-binding transcriptional regulator [Ruania rhizosphaerae]